MSSKCVCLFIQLTALLFAGLTTTSAADTDTERTFSDYKCKLVLPGSEYQWVNVENVPNATAGFGDNSGLRVGLAVSKASEEMILTERATREFDKGVLQAGGSKISGKIIQFNGLSCYQIHFQHPQDNSIATARVFVANGYLYELVIAGSPLSVDQRDQLEPLFASFQFIGTPVPPKTADTAYRLAFRIGEIVGEVVSFAFIAGGVFLLIKRLTRKPKSQLPLQP